MAYDRKLVLRLGLILFGPWLWAGCTAEPQATGGPPTNRGNRAAAAPLVEVALAQSPLNQDNLSYTGTTTPAKTVLLRSRVEGQLLSLSADVGEPVQGGAVVARLDNELLQIAIAEAQAELAAREFDVDQARSERAQAQAQVEQAKATLRQASVDAERLQGLAEAGAVTVQTAELAATEVQTAEQVLRAAEEQVKNRDRAIDSLERRVAAQAAVVAQTRKQSTYAQLIAPLTGTVLNRPAEPGDLIEPGQTVLEIGDLTVVQVEIRVSDRDLTQFALGQAVQVQLDAFPGQTFTGRVSQISPVADAAARLVPVEITLPNPGRKISSGLLARVRVATRREQAVMIPEAALSLAETDAPPALFADPVDPNRASQSRAIVFVLGNMDNETRVEARPVRIGRRQTGQVEILSGLQPGEAFVVESDAPLAGGQAVRRSFLSDS